MSRSEIIVGVYGGRGGRGWEDDGGGGGGDGGDGDGSLRGRMVCKRRSSVSLPFSPLAMVGGGGGFSRKSFSYSQLPQEPLKLSVLKLDGSCFDIEVMKMATVLELKEAVEHVFSFMPKKGPGKISWRHVWGQFCLCYDGQKLVTETDYIIDYGIKDGDQLHFIRHVSGVPSLTRKKSSVWLAASRQSRRSLSRSNSSEKEEETEEGDIENGNLPRDERGEDFGENINSTAANFLQGWFPYSRLAMIEDRRSEGKVTRSKCVDAFWSRVRTLLVFCSSAPYSQKDSWRD
ncbi:uncharacterized protein LOC115674255 [Syzygium oleosum]|uniref:uncharacterized protein LOC115674255 n=1 Tax=Syzygium oleosum TaxID=219896 RepID=UPI0024BB27B8|nr:uncharacterized protein LOC115674255 [Syzygium oleosum]